MQPRILILSASSGNGHVKAGEALAKAFCQANPTATVEHIDALTLVSPAMRNVYSRAYIRMVNRAPSVLGWLYNHLDTPYKDERRRLLVNRLNGLPLIKKIEEFNPDIVVCTHFLPADIVSMLIARQRIQAVHAVVITDLDAHGMWLGRHIDRYFVALPETLEHLASLGVPRTAITVTGIPIDPAFATIASNCKNHQSNLSEPTILVSAGGLGVGPVEELIAALAQTTRPIKVIALCGKNTDLVARLNSAYTEPTKTSRMQLKALGYIDNVHDYMAQADLIIGKPGGLTTAEALACGLAFVVVNPIPGQEERNSVHLLENGAAIRCNNMTTIAYKLNKLLNDPLRIATLQAGARAMGRPNAAMDIATLLLKDCKEKAGQESAVTPHQEPAVTAQLISSSTIARTTGSPTAQAERAPALQNRQNRLRQLRRLLPYTNRAV